GARSPSAVMRSSLTLTVIPPGQGRHVLPTGRCRGLPGGHTNREGRCYRPERTNRLATSPHPFSQSPPGSAEPGGRFCTERNAAGPRFAIPRTRVFRGVSRYAALRRNIHL